MSSFDFKIDEVPNSLFTLRDEVRTFLARELASGSYSRTAAGWDRYDAEFSRKIGAKGWIGMTWPRQYGGHERSSLERYVVSEELLVSGAPVRAHWLADRQFGPLVLKVGTEQQKRRFLPKIAAGECFVCVGLSEPDSGSDLSSIKTAAKKVEGGWRITGTKVWTSYAHKAHLINLFARTSKRDEKNRHAGVTQFVVELHSMGVSVRPIINLAGDHDFNEVSFDDVFVPDDNVLGTVGGAWSQVSEELAHERSGAERWVNSFGALVHAIDEFGPTPNESEAQATGRLISHLWTLHRMSFSIATMLQNGHVPEVEAALVKDLGTVFDQDVPKAIRAVMPEARQAWASEKFTQAFGRAMQYAPAASIRGGTREILRGIIARGLGLR